MQNLAGQPTADRQIRMELDAAGIPIEPAVAHRSEVPYTIVGRLGPFTFRRAWSYWVAEGPVPLEVARELYDDPVGRTDVRVAGHCGCPPPEEWSTWWTSDGKEVVPVADRDEFARMAGRFPSLKPYFDRTIFNDDPESVGARRYVESYHIDTYDGLCRFVRAIREHGLDALDTYPTVADRTLGGQGG